MSEFIKKNMTLVVVLGVTALIALVLIFMVVMQYQTINEKMLSIDTINGQINAITAQTNPRVVKQNAVRIKEDAAALEQKTKEQQRVFGCFLDSAVNAFIETLRKEAVSDDFKKFAGEMTLKSLHDILAGKVRDMGRDFKPENPGIDDLKKLYAAVEDEILASANEQDKAAYKKAFAAFAAEAAKETMEDLSSDKDEYSAQRAVFLQALGLPRSFRDIRFAQYFVMYAQDIIDNKKIPFEDEKDNNLEQIKILFTVGKFNSRSVDGEEQKTLELENIAQEFLPDVMTRIQIYENLIWNMSKNGLTLVSLCRAGDKYDPDETAKPYVTYRTTLKIRGSLPQIRKFANCLHQEYKNNRVYNVRSMRLSVDPPRDENENYISKSNQKNGYSGEINQFLKYVEMQNAEKNEKKLAAEAGNTNTKSSVQNKEYLKSIGAPLVGLSDKVYAVFEIDYIVFTGDQITNAKK